MSIIHALHHQTDQLLGYLTNEGEKLFWHDLYIHDMDGTHQYEFTMPSDIEEAQFFDERGRFLILAEDGGFEEFIVFESDSSMEGEKIVYGTATYKDMDKQYILEPGKYTGTVKELATLVLPDTEWEEGTVEYSGILTITVDNHIGAYSFLKRIASEFDIELRFRVEHSSNRITGRYVDFVERVGLNSKKEIELGKDLMGVEKTVHSDRVVTALMCVGPEREDGTRYTEIVTDDDAFQRWNRKGKHIIQIYEPQSNNQDMTREQLRQFGRTELNKRIASVVDYLITAASLEAKFPHEKVRFGDTLRVKNPDFSPPLYADARAIRIERSLTDPSSKVYKIGEVVTYTEDEILRVQRLLEVLYNERIPKSDTPPADPVKGQIWLDTSSEPNVFKRWDGTYWVKATPTVPEEIGAEPKIPEGTNPPSNPKVGDKWVDTSSTPVTLRIWDGLEWTAVQGPEGPQGPPGVDGVQGPEGDQGIQGPPGEDGVSSYTHIAYANSPDGTAGFSVSDSNNKLYIGIYVDSNPTDSTNPAAYNWTLIKGQDGSQGIPGPKGEDGQTPYFHTAYANNATGTSLFSTTDSNGRDYLGTYTDFTQADSTNPADYTWQKVKGEQGPQGVPGPAGEDGQPLYTWLKYADSPTSGMSDSPTGKAYIGLAYNKSSPSESSNFSDYTWSLIKGEKGDTGVQGPSGSDGQSRYTWIKYADSASGSGMSDSPAGKEYIGLAYNKTTATESASAADYTWSLIKGDKGDKGDTGETGAVGPQGVPGPPGANGQTYYTWLKYADTAAGAGMSDSPSGKTYIGIATNKTSPIESTNAEDYTWALIKGDQGIQGPAGEDGQTTYTWVKYADEENGSGLSDSPIGKKYIGMAFNKTTPTESISPSEYTWTPLYGNQNLVVNPAANGGILAGWSGSGLSVVNQVFDGFSVPVLQGATSGNVQYFSSYFKVDPSKAYMVSVWMKKSAVAGRVYLGLNMLDTSRAAISIKSVSSAGSDQGANSNFYFWYPSSPNQSPTDWIKLTGYIMPSGTNPARMKGIGEIVDRNAIMRPDTAEIRLRFLNWDNDTTRQLWVANPIVTEVDAETVLRVGEGVEKVRTDLRLTGPLPTSIQQNEEGITATTATSSNYARLDYRGLFVQGGALDLRTSTQINRGVVLDGGGLRGYNSSGVKKFEIDTDGNAYFDGVLGANVVKASNIAANAVTADKLNVTTLSAVASNLGTVTAGLIDGAMFKSGTGTNKTLQLSDGSATFTEKYPQINSVAQTKIDINDDGIKIEEKLSSTEIYTSHMYSMGIVFGNTDYNTSYDFNGLSVDYIGDTGNYQLPDNSISMYVPDGNKSRIASTKPLEIYANGHDLKMGTDDTLRLNGKPIGTSGNEVLWTGEWLAASGAAPPTKRLSDCPNGWVLVWSRYTNGAAQNSDWNVTYVHKRFANLFGGGGMWCPIMAITGVPIQKYMYFSDTQITGNAINDDGSNSGQCLRYVLSF